MAKKAMLIIVEKAYSGVDTAKNFGSLICFEKTWKKSDIMSTSIL